LWEQECHTPRLFFEWEVGATIFAAIVIGVLTARKTR